MAEKIGRHYSGTWSGTINRDPSSPDFIHHMDHPNATHKQMPDKSKGEINTSQDEKLKMYDAEMSGKL